MKVGDKVRVINAKVLGRLGAIGVISEPIEPSGWRVKFGEKNFCSIFEDDLEPILPTFSRGDLVEVVEGKCKGMRMFVGAEEAPASDVPLTFPGSFVSPPHWEKSENLRLVTPAPKPFLFEVGELVEIAATGVRLFVMSRTKNGSNLNIYGVTIDPDHLPHYLKDTDDEVYESDLRKVERGLI